jgi:hypothetical protein
MHIFFKKNYIRLDNRIDYTDIILDYENFILFFIDIVFSSHRPTLERKVNEDNYY